MRKLITLTITLFLVYTSCCQSNVYPATGNVGLGTTTPSHRLTLDLGSTRNGINIKSDGDAGAYSDLMFEMKTTTSVPTGKPTMWVFSSRKDGIFSNDISGNTLEIYANKKGGSYIAPLLFKTNGDLILAGARNATNGNVGIGTLAPAAKLTVGVLANDTIISALKIGIPHDPGVIAIPLGASPGGYNIDFATWRDMAPDQVGARIRAERINTYQANKAYVQGMDLCFSTSTAGNQTNLTERLRIRYNGNVGIGTALPTEKLSVKGKIRAQEIKVEAANWPDYVFDSSYHLMPLENIEKYIAENGHLPEVPSAKEVKQDGLSVGSNQALLLKKIEELTLHLIDLKKQVQELEAKQINQTSNKFRKEKRSRRCR